MTDIPQEGTKVRLTLVQKVLNVTESRVRYLSKVTPIDRFFEATLLKLIPEKVTPNQITIFRFICIPFVVILFLAQAYLAGTVLFVLAALSDALDGALARTKNHVTSWGILADPLADKLLIGLTALILITQFIGVELALIIVILELALVFSSYYRYKGKTVPAKTSGKIKMILQCFGLGFLMLYIMVGSPALLLIATYILYLAVLFALLSLFVYRSV